MHDLPDTMRAVVLSGHGGLDQLIYRNDYPTPRPGAGDIVVKVGACGLNNTDVNTRTAWYSSTVRDGITDGAARAGFAEADGAQGSWGRGALHFPRVQGADVAGTVAAVGRGVSGWQIGERVMIDPWLLGADDRAGARYLGSEVDGGFADYTAVPARNVHRVRSALSDAELATFPCAYTTAENLIARTGLGAGETVVISGASGGVGTAAIQLCRLRGAHIVAIAAQPKADQLTALGADAIVDRAAANLEAAIRDATPGGEAHVCLDVVGGETFAALISCLRRGGRYSSSGCIAGPLVEFDLRQLIYRDLQMTGATIVPEGTFARIVAHIERGALRPVLAATYPLTELARAQEAFLAKRHVGNIVVVP